MPGVNLIPYLNRHRASVVQPSASVVDAVRGGDTRSRRNAELGRTGDTVDALGVGDGSDRFVDLALSLFDHEGLGGLVRTRRTHLPAVDTRRDDVVIEDDDHRVGAVGRGSGVRLLDDAVVGDQVDLSRLDVLAFTDSDGTWHDGVVLVVTGLRDHRDVRVDPFHGRHTIGVDRDRLRKDVRHLLRPRVDHVGDDDRAAAQVLIEVDGDALRTVLDVPECAAIRCLEGLPEGQSRVGAFRDHGVRPGANPGRITVAEVGRQREVVRVVEGDGVSATERLHRERRLTLTARERQTSQVVRAEGGLGQLDVPHRVSSEDASRRRAGLGPGVVVALALDHRACREAGGFGELERGRDDRRVRVGAVAREGNRAVRVLRVVAGLVVDLHASVLYAGGSTREVLDHRRFEVARLGRDITTVDVLEPGVHPRLVLTCAPFTGDVVHDLDVGFDAIGGVRLTERPRDDLHFGLDVALHDAAEGDSVCRGGRRSFCNSQAGSECQRSGYCSHFPEEPLARLPVFGS